MTPDAVRFLEKARKQLDNAAAMLEIGLNEDAGRAAYLAGLQAAQGFIFEQCGKVVKTHNGVQTEFLRLTKDDPRFTIDHRIFLSQTYNLKAIADYETGPDASVSPDRAAQAVEAGRQFVAHIVSLLPSEPSI